MSCASLWRPGGFRFTVASPLNFEKLKQRAEQAEREGDYGQVAEIRYGRVKEQEQSISNLQTQLNELSQHEKGTRFFGFNLFLTGRNSGK